MTRIINFSKLKIFMFSLSIILIVLGVAGTFRQGGVNLGIDFQAGLSQRVQIAPVAFTVGYEKEGTSVIDVTGQGMYIKIKKSDGTKEYDFPFKSYTNLRVLTDALLQIDGITIELNAPEFTESSRIIGFNFEKELSAAQAVPINIVNVDANNYIPIEKIRDSLKGIGAPQIQIVGKPYSQEFLLKIEDSREDKDFIANMSRKIVSLLENEFGKNMIIIKQSDYVGARFSKNIGQQTVYLTVFALLLILLYIWFRFKFAYAVSAIAALVHDVLIMFGFIGIFQMEISTSTIAAVLTIIGYSLNDTIVVFDRIRENTGLMRDEDFEVIVNTSISQSLSRTLITSLTTLLAVGALYIFGAGAIKNFALNMIVGIIVGTYSSIFIASPILLTWVSAGKKHKRLKDVQKYGIKIDQQPDKKQDEMIEEKKPVVIEKVERKLKGKRQKKKKK